MIAFLFPGQGAQYKGMGEGLFEKYPDIVRTANDILGYSIEELCLNDENNLLNKTEYTQVALYVVNCLYYMNEIENNKKKPDIVIGNSLGEYNALFAAGCISFEDGLRMVKERGRLMGQSSNGTMAAIIGLQADEIEEVIKEQDASDYIQISNFNTKYQSVIAGEPSKIDMILPFMVKKGARKAIRLNVGGAFHSRYMKRAEEEFESFLRRFSFSEPQSIVFSNFLGKEYKKNEIFYPLLHQISNPVKLRESIKNAIHMGAIEFVEVGPGKTMSNIFKENAKEFQSKNISNLGSKDFREEYNVNYAYVVSGLKRGITGVEVAKKLYKNKILGFVGIDCLDKEEVKKIIEHAKTEIPPEYLGVHFSNDLYDSDRAEKIINYLIEQNICNIEVSDFVKPSKELIKYRLKGIRVASNGKITFSNKILVHASTIKCAKAFMNPISDKLLKEMVLAGDITEEIAALAVTVPICDDICIDDEWHGMEAIGKLRDIGNINTYVKNIRFGIGGRIGGPASVALAFFCGADFVVTTAINQCTIEANTSEYVKELLQDATENDFAYAPTDELFEFGLRTSVLKKGSLYHIRATKIYEIYCQYNGIEDIPLDIRNTIFMKYYKTSLEEVFANITKQMNEEEVRRLEGRPKEKMGLIFKWLLVKSFKDACVGNIENKANYLVLASREMADLNRFFENTEHFAWGNRSVVDIAVGLMNVGEKILNERCNYLMTIRD